MEQCIVTDARLRMTLPIIRSLATGGVSVMCAEREKTACADALGFYSKYVDETMRYPAADSDPSGFIARMEEYSDRVILPVAMDSVLAMSENRERFKAVALPSIEDMKIANDKLALARLAEKIRVACPKTVTSTENAPLPAVIKYKNGELLGLSPNQRYRIVRTREELLRGFAEMSEISPELLIAEYVEGDAFGVSAVFDKEHKPMKVFCHRRIREYPISGGPSSACESVWNEKLVENALALLSALNWVGVAMVEFKGDMLMEINPRFWGSHALAPLSGCHIPRALFDAARGELASGEVFCDYRVGKKMRFFLQDTLALAALARAKKPLLGSLNPFISDGVFSWRDFRASAHYFRRAIKKRDKIL